MVISWDAQESEYVSRKLTYPGYPDAPKRTSVLRSHAKSAYAVGQWGVYGAGGSEYTGLVRIDPEADELREEDTLDPRATSAASTHRWPARDAGRLSRRREGSRQTEPPESSFG